jgi:xylulokinase
LLGVPLVIGGGDQQCAALGSGMIHLGQSLLNIGTASAVMAAVNEPVRDPNSIIPCVCHAAPGQWEMEGHTQASGIVLQRYRDEFSDREKLEAHKTQGDVYDLITQQASQSTPGAQGLMFLPMMNGSTAPRDEPSGSAALIGLKISHTKADILRSILEGICYENRWMLETMIQSGSAMENIFITGGASKSVFWNQLHADILKHPVVQVQTSNAALVGAAICAGIGIGLFADASEGVRRLVRFGDTFQPVANGVKAYDVLFERFTRTYAMLCDQDIFKDLRSIAEMPGDEK